MIEALHLESPAKVNLRLEILKKDGWSHLNLTDGVVIGKLHAGHTHKAEGEEIGEVLQRNEDALSVKEKKDDQKGEGGKGQTDENQFSRGKSDVEKGFGDHA